MTDIRSLFHVPTDEEIARSREAHLSKARARERRRKSAERSPGRRSGYVSILPLQTALRDQLHSRFNGDQSAMAAHLGIGDSWLGILIQGKRQSRVRWATVERLVDAMRTGRRPEDLYPDQ